jgi:hypothetical protein
MKLGGVQAHERATCDDGSGGVSRQEIRFVAQSGHHSAQLLQECGGEGTARPQPLEATPELWHGSVTPVASELATRPASPQMSWTDKIISFPQPPGQRRHFFRKTQLIPVAQRTRQGPPRHPVFPERWGAPCAAARVATHFAEPSTQGASRSVDSVPSLRRRRAGGRERAKLPDRRAHRPTH